MGITPGEWYFWSGCEGTVKLLGGEMWDSEFYFKRLKLVPWLLKPQYQEERKNPSCLGLLNFTMVLNWEIKPYLRASHHSQGQFHCGPIIHPRYHFGTEEANVQSPSSGWLWWWLVCVGPLSPCNSRKRERWSISCLMYNIKYFRKSNCWYKNPKSGGTCDFYHIYIASLLFGTLPNSYFLIKCDEKVKSITNSS